MSTLPIDADPSAVLDLLDSLEQAIEDLPRMGTSPPSPPPPPPPQAPVRSIIPTAARNQLAYLKAGVPAATRPSPGGSAPAPSPASANPVVAVISTPRTGADPFAPTRTAHRDPPPKPHGYVATRGPASQVLAAFPWEPQRR